MTAAGAKLVPSPLQRLPDRQEPRGNASNSANYRGCQPAACCILSTAQATNTAQPSTEAKGVTPSGALASMRLKLAAGHDRVAAVTQDACHGVHARLDVDLTLQQQALLDCPVLHWFTMLHTHTGDCSSVQRLQQKLPRAAWWCH